MRLRSPSLWPRLFLGILGGASFAAGAVAVFKSGNGTGTGVLIAFGGVMLALAVLGDRVESLELGGGKLQYHAMLLAEMMIGGLDEGQRQSLSGVILGARNLRFRRDTGRWLLSERILGGLAERSGGVSGAR
jgi:hypothetical protein